MTSACSTTLNAQINDTNDRVLPLLQVADRPGFRRRSQTLAEVVDRPARAGARFRATSDTKPMLTDTVAMPGHDPESADGQRSGHGRITPASQPALSCTRSTARGRSSRSRSVTASCRRIRRPAHSTVRPVVAVHVNKPKPTLKITIGQRNRRRHRHPSLLAGRARAGRWPAT